LAKLLRKPGRLCRPTELYDPLAEQLNLSAELRHRPRLDKSEPLWNNHVQFARRRLVDQGIMSRAPRGWWGLTEWKKNA